MDDIEDLVLNEDFWDSNTRLVRTDVVPKVRRRNKIKNVDLANQLAGENISNQCGKEGCCSDDKKPQHEPPSSDNCECSHSKQASNEKIVESDSSKKIGSKFSHNKLSPGNNVVSNVPGLGQVYVRTWGCAHNSSDSEYMAGQLAAYGYDIVDNRDEADLWLLNSCTVKNPAEDHLRNEIKAAHSQGKKVVVAGCVSQGAPKSEFLAGLSLVGVQQIDRIVEVVEETLAGNSVRLMGMKKAAGKRLGGASLALPKIRRNPLVEIISINTGCLNACTYCKTKHARGHLASYSVEEIIARAVQSFEEGVVEIWLTSEDTGAYGRDIGESLPSLLRELVKVIPEGCRLRLGMTNPPYILDHLQEMAAILAHPRVYKFLHVPVQSGSDAVLADMKREYTRRDFCTVVDTLRELVPGISIATDIIAGYPTEEEKDWQDSMSLCRDYRFPSLFINQFFPRPGTPAARLPRIDTKLVKTRTKELSDFFQSYQPYEGSEGQTQSVLVTEQSSDGNYWVAHNQFYHQVLVPKEEGLLGKTLDVEIFETGKYYVKANIISSCPTTQTQHLPQGTLSGGKSVEESSSKVQNRSRNDLIFKISFILLLLALVVRFYARHYL